MSKSVENITVNDQDVEIQFRKDVIETSEVKKYEYLTKYITAIKKSHDFESDIELLKRLRTKN